MGGGLLAMSNSGSGNQGLPQHCLMVVAEFIKADDETLRALVLSHLMAIYVHSHFPPFSALCAAKPLQWGQPQE